MHFVTLRYKLLYKRWMPIIPVTLTWRQSVIHSEAYLDSGAFYSIFKLGIATDLGLAFRRSKARMFVVADGRFIPARLAKLPMEIGGRRKVAEMTFSDRLNVGFNLLGRKDVFEGFDEVIFREARREVELRWGEE